MFFGRSADEYDRLWNLRIDERQGRTVLDCPCGPSTFVASSRAAGVMATGANPVLPGIPDSIDSRGIADIFETLDLIRKQDPALEGFVVMVRTVPTPIVDHGINLVLSAHLSSCDAGTDRSGMAEEDAALDQGFHFRAIDELAPVAGSEIRLYPALAINTEKPSPIHGSGSSEKGSKNTASRPEPWIPVVNGASAPPMRS